MEAQILSVRDFQQMQSYREQLISNSEPDALAAALLPSRKSQLISTKRRQRLINLFTEHTYETLQCLACTLAYPITLHIAKL
jgi:hypothetical protein